tara:strand:- start:483 stop:992 length:510 start_codon:yes stop_codon:yes gene_type:complete
MLQEYLLKVDEVFLYISSLAMLVSFFVFREFNSHTLTSIIVIVSEAISSKLENPLMVLATNSSNEIGRLIWYGTWMLIAFFVVWILYKSHEWLNISSSSVSDKIGKSFIAYASLQALGYADSMFFQSSILDSVYRYGIASVTVSVTLILFWELRRVKVNGRVVSHHSDG